MHRLSIGSNIYQLNQPDILGIIDSGSITSLRSPWGPVSLRLLVRPHLAWDLAWRPWGAQDRRPWRIHVVNINGGGRICWMNGESWWMNGELMMDEWIHSLCHYEFIGWSVGFMLNRVEIYGGNIWWTYPSRRGPVGWPTAKHPSQGPGPCCNSQSKGWTLSRTCPTDVIFLANRPSTSVFGPCQNLQVLSPFQFYLRRRCGDRIGTSEYLGKSFRLPLKHCLKILFLLGCRSAGPQIIAFRHGSQAWQPTSSMHIICQCIWSCILCSFSMVNLEHVIIFKLVEASLSLSLLLVLLSLTVPYGKYLVKLSRNGSNLVDLFLCQIRKGIACRFPSI